MMMIVHKCKQRSSLNHVNYKYVSNQTVVPFYSHNHNNNTTNILKRNNITPGKDKYEAKW